MACKCTSTRNRDLADGENYSYVDDRHDDAAGGYATNGDDDHDATCSDEEGKHEQREDEERKAWQSDFFV